MGARSRSTLLSVARSTLTGQRLLLGLKAALAVGIAWTLAHYMPGVTDQYPYYAPLGALVSMYPTFMGSVRSGLQTLAGLLMGILLAVAVLLFGSPNVVSISLAVGIGVVLGGIKRLGAGREYVSVAALFVLIVGGQNADSYSLSYLLQMSLGVVVGLLVNLLIFPPLTFDAAILQKSRCRHVLAGQLDDIAEAMVERWPPAHEDWADRSTALAATTAEVRSAIREADDSRKGNPRAVRRRRHLAADYDDLAALENITFHVRNLSEVLAGAVWGRWFDVDIKPELLPPLSSAMAAVASVLREWDKDADTREPLAAAEDALRALTGELDAYRESGATSLSPAAAVAMDLRRILTSLWNTTTDAGREGGQD